MRLTLFLFVGLAVQAQPVITSDTTPPIVLHGATHSFTATGSGTITWSLTAGSVGSIVAATGVYTAPATVTVNQSIYGCQLLPPDSAYNMRVDSLPVRADSATMVGYLQAPGQPIKFVADNVPTNVLSSGTPSRAMQFVWTGGNNGNYQIPDFPTLQLQFGYYMRGGDRHYIGVRPDTCLITEIYNSGWNKPTYNIYPNSSSGLSYQSITGQLPANGGTNAAGTYLLAGMLRTQEVMKALATGATVVPHVLNISLNNYSQLCASAGSQQWPATAFASLCTPNHIRYGDRFRLGAAYTYGGTNPVTSILVNTMKQYGFIVSDGTTGNNALDLYGLDADIPPPQMASAIDEIAALFTPANLTNFEFVDGTVVAPTTKTGPIGGLLDPTAAAAAGYTMPQFANVCATDTNGTTCMRVLLQGPVIDFEQSEYTFQAGASAYTIPYHLTGVAAGVTCSMSPSVGTLVAASCTYTPPASVASPTLTTITITSTANAALKTQTNVLVLPSGTLHLLSSQAANFTDNNSTVWTTLSPRSGFPAFQQTWVPNLGVSISCVGSYPTNQPPNYQVFCTGYNPRGDIGFQMRTVPGQYLVTVQIPSLAVPASSPLYFEVQGVGVYAFMHQERLANGVANVWKSMPMPATVAADGLLTVWSRHNDDGAAIAVDTAPQMSGLQIDPVSCPGASTITIGGVWWPYGVNGPSTTTVDPCAAAPSLAQRPWALFPIPGGVSR